MSVVVLYNGQRKTLRPAPGASVQVFVAECAVAFGIDSAANNVHLSHKKTMINPSQPWRYTSVPNNAVIDLVVRPTGSSTSSSSSTSCSSSASTPRITNTKIALSVEGLGSFVITVSSSSTFCELLRAVVEAEVANQAAISQILEVRSTLIYMGTPFDSEVFEKTTLETIGLSGQSARLQLKLSKVPHTYACSPQKIEQSSAAVNPEYGGVGNGRSGGVDMVTESSDASNLAISHTSNYNPNPNSTSSNNSSSSVATSANATSFAAQQQQQQQQQQLQLLQQQKQQQQQQQQHQEQQPQQPKLSMEDSMKFVYSSNFTVVSRDAIMMLTKCIVNILQNFEESKYRTLKSSNKVFREVIQKCKGATELMLSIGFEQQYQTASATPAPTMLLQSIFQSSGSGGDSSSRDIVYLFPSTDRDQVLDLYGFLCQELERELDVSPDSIPKFVAPDPNATAFASPRAAPIPFDPYKSVVMSTSGQPKERGEGSHVDMKLDQLQKRRRELEGDLSSVKTKTLVLTRQMVNLFPKDVSSRMEVDGESTGGSGLLFAKFKKSQEEKPLTTKALRELEKAKGERVYSQVVVKVKLQDGVSIQGFFHPRSLLKDVYRWLWGCFRPLVDQLGSSGSIDLNAADINFQSVFELVCSSFPGTSSLSSCLDQTLFDLKFVPAISFSLSYSAAVKSDPACRSLLASVSSYSGSNPLDELMTARFISVDILNESRELVEQDPTNVNGYAPVGAKLIEAPTTNSAAGINSNNSSSISNSSNSSSSMGIDGKSGGAGGPSWLKLGKK